MNDRNTAKQNYPGLVASYYNSRPGNEVGAYSTTLPSPHGRLNKTVTESETDEFNTQRCVQCTTVKFDMAVPAMFSAKHWYDPTLEILAGNWRLPSDCSHDSSIGSSSRRLHRILPTSEIVTTSALTTTSRDHTETKNYVYQATNRQINTANTTSRYTVSWPLWHAITDHRLSQIEAWLNVFNEVGL